MEGRRKKELERRFLRTLLNGRWRLLGRSRMRIEVAGHHILLPQLHYERVRVWIQEASRWI